MLKEIKEYYEKHHKLPDSRDIKMKNGFSFHYYKVRKYFVRYSDLCEQATGVKTKRPTPSVNTTCDNCGKSIIKHYNAFIRVSHHFCGSKCSATYQNKHKDYGYKRSKLEIYIEDNLKKDYPNLQFICNDKGAIQSELDFYFPTLKFAVELNGIFHYEPIYGSDTFEKIQNRDKQKIICCYEKGIELAILDTSKFHHRKREDGEEYYQIFKGILNSILQREKIKSTNLPHS